MRVSYRTLGSSKNRLHITGCCSWWSPLLGILHFLLAPTTSCEDTDFGKPSIQHWLLEPSFRRGTREMGGLLSSLMGGILPSVKVVGGKPFPSTLRRFLRMRKSYLTMRSSMRLKTTLTRLNGRSLFRLVIPLNMYSPYLLGWGQVHLVVPIFQLVERRLQTLVPSTHARIGSPGSLSRRLGKYRGNID